MGRIELACVLEACEGGGALECVAQRIDTLDSVCATTISDATECIVGQAAEAVHTQRQRLLTQRQAEAQSPCKVQGACGPPEARQLRVWQRVGKLEDARHVRAFDIVASQMVVVEAVRKGGEQ